MKWILQEDVFDEDLEGLKRSINKFGMEYEVVKYIPFQSGVYDYSSDCVFYGSLELAKQLIQQTNCKVYYTPGLYNCMSYYTGFKNLLLNWKCSVIEYKDLIKHKDYLFETYGSRPYGCIFIRPDRDDKVFTGQVVCPNTFDSDIEFINRYNNIPDDCLVLVSACHKIDSEYRFVIYKKSLVTGSLYRQGNDLIHREVADNSDVSIYVKLVLSIISVETDDLWTMDVCSVNGEYKVLEIGCFSCAGLYACNTDKIMNIIINKEKYKQ